MALPADDHNTEGSVSPWPAKYLLEHFLMGASQHCALALKCYTYLVLAGGPDPHPREASGQADHHRSAMLFPTAPRMKLPLSSYLVPALLT